MLTTTPTETVHHWPVYGHDWAVALLRSSLAHGRVRHAYLITGPESVGKETLARAFAMALNCAEPDAGARPCGVCRPCRLITAGGHPDLLYAEPDTDTGALKIEAIRAVTRGLALKPFEARFRVAIFRAFERAQGPAQDALLKTLEEPPPSAVLLVLARGAEALLPTIISRSQVLALRPVPPAVVRAVLVGQHSADPQQAEALAHLSGGRLGWALRALADPDALAQRNAAFDTLEQSLALNRAGRFKLAETLSGNRQTLAAVLELWQSFWRDVLLLCEDSRLGPANADRVTQVQRMSISLTPAEALAALQATRHALGLLSTNTNLRLALEVMLLDYPRLRRD